MKHLHRLVPLVMTGAASLSSCVLLDAEVEIEEACGVRRAVTVEAVPADTDAFAEPLLIDLGSALHDALAGFDDVDADFEFTRATITATQGVDDLGFVEAVQLGLITTDAAGRETETDVFACDGDCVGTDGAIGLPAAVPTAANAALAAPGLTAVLDVRGAMPSQAWAFDVAVCAKGKIRWQLEP
jgi:hypothetical protein